jgi:hypothetical protein
MPLIGYVTYSSLTHFRAALLPEDGVTIPAELLKKLAVQLLVFSDTWGPRCPTVREGSQ